MEDRSPWVQEETNLSPFTHKKARIIQLEQLQNNILTKLHKKHKEQDIYMLLRIICKNNPTESGLETFMNQVYLCLLKNVWMSQKCVCVKTQ